MTGAIFVFGSNLRGAHSKGAALDARKKHGAIYGQGEGLQGLSYGIPTKDERIQTLPLHRIEWHVIRFIDFARSRPDLRFHVTRVGCGLAGYSDEQMAPFFFDAPDNCFLPIDWQYLRYAGQVMPSHAFFDWELDQKIIEANTQSKSRLYDAGIIERTR